MSMVSLDLAPMNVLSFDVEEHWRIEAAAHLQLDQGRKNYYAERVEEPTLWLLEQLARFEQKATFFVVGQLARAQPGLVRAMHAAGHEVASHGWDHRRIHALTPEAFRDDVLKSKDTLEQILGEPIIGYRAPTFSVVRQTGWALDVLAEEGFAYDSSVYPVRHDRYGVPEAPRGPFLAGGESLKILELPPARLDLWGVQLPMGGGGYFRLLPLALMDLALEQSVCDQWPPVAVTYFHPWEFDRDQQRLPLSKFSQFRTYVGIERSRPRLVQLLRRHRFVRAQDILAALTPVLDRLPCYRVAEVHAPAPCLRDLAIVH